MYTNTRNTVRKRSCPSLRATLLFLTLGQLVSRGSKARPQACVAVAWAVGWE